MLDDSVCQGCHHALQTTCVEDEIVVGFIPPMRKKRLVESNYLLGNLYDG